jgi:hypothetical protein
MDALAEYIKATVKAKLKIWFSIYKA